jgi:hypothetical protein
MPQAKRKYVIGADVAEGISRVDDSHAGMTDRDFSDACVLEMKTGDLVAAWHGRIPSNEYAVVLDQIGTYYNFAMIAVEVNNQGVSTVHSLDASGYPNMYLPQVAKHPRMHDYIGLKNLGWVTSRSTRPVLIDAIREALSGPARIPWMMLLRQMESMEVDPKTGFPKAPYGMHDDAVMAFGIAECARVETLVAGDEYDGKMNETLDPDSRRIFRALRQMREAEKERVDDV